MIVMASAMTPPPPMPWMARAPISHGIDGASPDRVEPTRKITIAVWNTRVRPYMSEIRPNSGVAAVAASR